MKKSFVTIRRPTDHDRHWHVVNASEMGGEMCFASTDIIALAAFVRLLASMNAKVDFVVSAPIRGILALATLESTVVHEN